MISQLPHAKLLSTSILLLRFSTEHHLLGIIFLFTLTSWLAIIPCILLVSFGFSCLPFELQCIPSVNFYKPSTQLYFVWRDWNFTYTLLLMCYLGWDVLIHTDNLSTFKRLLFVAGEKYINLIIGNLLCFFNHLKYFLVSSMSHSFMTMSPWWIWKTACFLNLRIHVFLFHSCKFLSLCLKIFPHANSIIYLYKSC